MTKIINLFGGPGVGKSSIAYSMAGYLKRFSVNCELVTEFAKDLVWQDRSHQLRHQVYIFGKQLYKIEYLLGKVDIIVTDSPFLLSHIYCGEEYPNSFKQAIIDIWHKYDNINYNFLVKRCKSSRYQNIGRVHTEQESKNLQQKIVNLLEKEKISYCCVDKENFCDIISEKVANEQNL